jgi:thioesterase domain-containing protein
MARNLMEQQREVALVALLDTYNLSLAIRPQSFLRRLSYLGQKLGFHLQNLIQLDGNSLVRYLSEKLRMASEASIETLASRIGSLKQRVTGSGEGEPVELAIQELNHQAAWIYVPGPYHGPVVLFKPCKNYNFYSDPQMGWGTLARSNLVVVELQSNPHAMLLEPFVESLARQLKDRILAAAAARRSPGTERQPSAAIS